jgi:uncharacterized protein (TIGR02145 family)
MKKQVLLLLLVILIFQGCKKDKESKPDDKPIEEEVFSTGLKFTDKDVYAAIQKVSLPMYGAVFPSSFELKLPPPRSQGKEGSCLPFAVAYGVMGYYIGDFENSLGFVNEKRVGSPEFLYNLIASGNCDGGSVFVAPSGSNERGVLDVLKESGVCTWDMMPYSDKGCSTLPNSEQLVEAKNYKILKYERIDEFNEQKIKNTLLNDHPIIIACEVDNDFGNRLFNLINPPIWKEVRGKTSGHAMIIMGYDDKKKAFKIQNSWGAQWGTGGYVWMDYEAAPTLIQQAYIVYPDIVRPNATTPTVQTTLITNISKNSAQSGGSITYDGGASVTVKGVVWNTSQNPTIAHSRTNESSGSGSFISNITGLQHNTTYYVRAYATNSAGTSYGNQVSFKTTTVSASNPYLNPNLTYGLVTDIDGNKYATIRIGNQTWMAENLKVTRYNDGTEIPHVREQSWSSIGEARSFYNLNIANNEIYGTLYNGNTVLTGKICPTGWHVPNDDEWWTLIDYLGGPPVAGGKLKSTTNLWESPNTGATNSSGFSALPGGFREYSSFVNLGYTGSFWTSTEAIGGLRHRYLANDDVSIIRTQYGVSKSSLGYSCRCIKN